MGSRGGSGLDSLTIADLQRLEQLAIQAAKEGGAGGQEGERLTNLLRRSLSLGGASLGLLPRLCCSRLF